MKRDMDLVRRILLEVEKTQYPGGPHELSIEGYAKEEVTYHIELLKEAGLLLAMSTKSFGGVQHYPIRLTWEGHEFLDAARDDIRWSRTKEVMGKVGGFTLEMVKAVLIALLKEAVGQYMALP